MKSRSLFFVLATLFLSSLSTQADSLLQPVEKLELLKVGSEFYPDQIYSLGLEVDPIRQSILAVYFHDPYPDARIPYQRFPLSTLLKPQVLIRVKNQYDVVKISMSGTFLTVSFRKDVRENLWNSKRFEIDCNSSNTHCGVIDPVTHRYVTHAYITAHRAYIMGVFEKAVGIETILTR